MNRKLCDKTCSRSLDCELQKIVAFEKTPGANAPGEPFKRIA
jgi:hypothetical protein